jgi:steroid delta-isomerase-like uncharacterized protein
MAEQSLVDIAKAPIVAYNDKNWDAVKAAVAPGFIYDEVGTQRKIQGINDVLAAWRGWATAIPDSKATFDNASTSGNTVILEVTWRGTQTGPLQTPTGQILQPSGRKIELRACQVIEVANGKVQVMRHYYDMVTMLQQLGALSGV